MDPGIPLMKIRTDGRKPASHPITHGSAECLILVSDWPRSFDEALFLVLGRSLSLKLSFSSKYDLGRARYSL